MPLARDGYINMGPRVIGNESGDKFMGDKDNKCLEPTRPLLLISLALAHYRAVGQCSNLVKNPEGNFGVRFPTLTYLVIFCSGWLKASLYRLRRGPAFPTSSPRCFSPYSSLQPCPVLLPLPILHCIQNHM